MPPLILEFPAADELYAAHVGYTGVAEISNRVGPGEHQLVLRAGFDFPTAVIRREADHEATGEALKVSEEGGPAATGPVSLGDPRLITSSTAPGSEAGIATLRGPEPATTIHVQTRSGAALTLRIYAVGSVEDATRRCVVSYDPEEGSRARAQAGLATGLK